MMLKFINYHDSLRPSNIPMSDSLWPCLSISDTCPVKCNLGFGGLEYSPNSHRYINASSLLSVLSFSPFLHVIFLSISSWRFGCDGMHIHRHTQEIIEPPSNMKCPRLDNLAPIALSPRGAKEF
jgi:hypothetical protein